MCTKLPRFSLILTDTKVTIHGLKSEAGSKHNMKQGIVGEYDEEKGRYTVKVKRLL